MAIHVRAWVHISQNIEIYAARFDARAKPNVGVPVIMSAGQKCSFTGLQKTKAFC
jgi:hypothetical protein